ncbi:hypothetical protein QA601_07530 [Chitinispirillales bacterium ANBcel5]|uniref:hypothetical protein n=1 Tax=Cellulosispirillum alkaliphilum TaxID=3039283 RepID=UPI002A5498F0|nr:hypothetical protein [Chitinispirillales bacterium ANBcel5]
MKLASEITLIPVLHGKIAFAAHVRKLCNSENFDAIAIDVPLTFEQDLGEAVDRLPFISALTAKDNEDHLFYVPIDPCDSTIEAVRQARQKRIPFHCIGFPKLSIPSPMQGLPDEYAINSVGFDTFSALCLHAAKLPQKGSYNDEAARFIAHKLLQLKQSQKNVLALVHFRRFAAVVKHFGKEETYNALFAPAPTYSLSKFLINPDHLYFALGELPFVTAKFEKERQNIFSEPVDIIDCIKDLFRETRDDYMDHSIAAEELSPVRIQAALSYLRNLTVMSQRFLPSLFDIIEAAKGVGGNAYAVRILKSARYYPFLPFDSNERIMDTGISNVALSSEVGPGDKKEIFESTNLFRDMQMHWKTLSIKPDPSLEKRKKYKYTWNPLGMCSHQPEDIRIENFNSHLRHRSLQILSESYSKSEKFTSSVKDGIDIRETLRNWYTGDIYVKEIPPVKGKIDTVVILFDENNDHLYPHRTVWYAEHDQESTLTFYASDPFEDLIGPGVARCTYGGLSLLFPPRTIPSAFEVTGELNLTDCASKLVAGALMFSREKAVAIVSAQKPDIKKRMLASRFKKHLVWIPMASFSSETLRKLRRFHILNGKNVRSWASRFIGD